MLVNVREAVDTAVIPLGSTVEIRYADGTTERATAEDIGGTIRGNKIDILRSSYGKAIEFGRQDVEIRVSRYYARKKDTTQETCLSCVV